RRPGREPNVGPGGPARPFIRGVERMKRTRSGGGRDRSSRRARDPLATRNGSARNGRSHPTRNGHARNGHAAKPPPAPEPQLTTRVAQPADVVHVPRIARLLTDAAQAGAIIAERPPDYLESAIRERRAVVVLRATELVGFVAAHAWEGARFVSHSAMV